MGGDFVPIDQRFTIERCQRHDTICERLTPVVLVHPQMGQWFLCRLLVGHRVQTLSSSSSSSSATTPPPQTKSRGECHLFSYQPSIRVVGSDRSDWVELVQDCISATLQVNTNMDQNQSIPILHVKLPTGCHGSSHIPTFKPISSSSPPPPETTNAVIPCTESDGFIATIRYPPVMIMSISLKLVHAASHTTTNTTIGHPRETTGEKDPEQNLTLWMACLKRQLVGTHVVWHPRKPSIRTEWMIVANHDNKNKNDDDDVTEKKKFTRTTTAQPQTWIFQTESIIPTTTVTTSNSSSSSSSTSSSLNGCRMGVILPRTRITIHMEGGSVPRPESNHYIQDRMRKRKSQMVSSSPVQLLVDTVRCMQLSCYDLPRTFLFTGPPGVGKTHAIRQALTVLQGSDNDDGNDNNNSFQLSFVSVTGSDLYFNGDHPSQAAMGLYQQFDRAREQARDRGSDAVALIFLDECDALMTVEPVSAMLAYLLDQIHSNDQWRHVIVAAATNRIDTIPVTLRRPGRFDREIAFAPPTAAERKRVLQSLLVDIEETREYGRYCHVSDVEIQEIADLCVGYVPADLNALLRRAYLLWTSEASNDDGFMDSIDGINKKGCESSLTPYLKRAMNDVGASALRDARMSAPPTSTWDDIAGDAGGAKTALRQAIEWPRTRRAAYEALHLNAPRGILLYGPPGCSKTSLARAAAGATGVAFLSFTPADVYSSSYVGDAESVVRRAFDLARAAAPCILFFDELDAIIGSESQHIGMGRGAGAEARVLSTFLNEMDGVDGSWKDGVLVLGATNRPWTIDSAMLRPGRFDKIIYVPPPDADARKAIFKMHCGHWDSAIDYEWLEARTESMTGAEITGVCHEAMLAALRDSMDIANPKQYKPNMSHLIQSINNVQPLLQTNPMLFEEFRLFQKRQKQFC